MHSFVQEIMNSISRNRMYFKHWIFYIMNNYKINNLNHTCVKQKVNSLNLKKQKKDSIFVKPV